MYLFNVKESNFIFFFFICNMSNVDDWFCLGHSFTDLPSFFSELYQILMPTPLHNF